MYNHFISYKRGYQKVMDSLPAAHAFTPTLLEVIREHKYTLLLMYQDSNGCNSYYEGMAAAIAKVEKSTYFELALATAKTKTKQRVSGARAGGASPKSGRGYSDTDYKVHFPSLRED